MKKWFLAIAAILLFAAPASLLANARRDGMAVDIRQVEDIDLIWLYPNKAVEYKNTLDFRLADTGAALNSGTGHEWGGVLAEEKGLGVIGFYVNRPPALNSSWNPLANVRSIWPSALSQDYSPLGGFFFGTIANDVDLFWADSLGGGDSLGVHLSFMDGFPSTASGGGDSQAYGLALGLGLSGGFFNQFNLHTDFAFQNFTGMIIGPPSGKDNGIHTAKLGALGQADLEKDFSLRSFLDLQLDDTDFGTLAPIPLKLSDWSLVLGTALTRNILGGKGLVSTGLTLGYNNNHFDDPTPAIFTTFDESLYQLVWNACAEAEVSDWLTLRTGVAANLMARMYNSIGFGGVPTWQDMSNQRAVFNMGFSIRFQNFTLDGSLQTASVENVIASVQPGGSIFFPAANNLMVGTCDLKYKF